MGVHPVRCTSLTVRQPPAFRPLPPSISHLTCLLFLFTIDQTKHSRHSPHFLIMRTPQSCQGFLQFNAVRPSARAVPRRRQCGVKLNPSRRSFAHVREHFQHTITSVKYSLSPAFPGQYLLSIPLSRRSLAMRQGAFVSSSRKGTLTRHFCLPWMMAMRSLRSFLVRTLGLRH
jgi:hypothetical protein